MNSRSSKLKAQSSKEAPRNKLKTPGLSEEWKIIYEIENSGAAALRDAPSDSTNGHPWDLCERTAVFGEKIIRFCKKIPRSPINDRLIDQLVGAGTSVGANYHEANEAVSRRDFKSTISRCMKEAKEAKFFLRMVVASEPQLADEARPLYREAHEFLRIFGSMRHRPRTP
jgi:four helix bundle protein